MGGLWPRRELASGHSEPPRLPVAGEADRFLPPAGVPTWTTAIAACGNHCRNAGADAGCARGRMWMLAIREMAGEVTRRYDAIVRTEGHSLFVAEHNEQVIGLLHLYARPALDKPPAIIVQALVVDDAARGSGIGRAVWERPKDMLVGRGSCPWRSHLTFPNHKHMPFMGG